MANFDSNTVPPTIQHLHLDDLYCLLDSEEKLLTAMNGFNCLLTLFLGGVNLYPADFFGYLPTTITDLVLNTALLAGAVDSYAAPETASFSGHPSSTAQHY